MNKKNCKEALEIYRKFLSRMDSVKEFLKVAEVGWSLLLQLCYMLNVFAAVVGVVVFLSCQSIHLLKGYGQRLDKLLRKPLHPGVLLYPIMPKWIFQLPVTQEAWRGIGYDCCGIYHFALAKSDNALKITLHPFFNCAFFSERSIHFYKLGVIDIEIFTIGSFLGIMCLFGTYIGKKIVDKIGKKVHQTLIEFFMLSGSIIMIIRALTLD